MHSEFANPQSITNFDVLDFVLVDGDSSALPWSPGMRKLALLTKMCMMTGKCLFASGTGAGLLAYVCSTGGEHFRVTNNEGRGSLIDDIQAIPPPNPARQQQQQHLASTDVLLDAKLGDFFVFGSKESCWIPKGNTGFVLHSSDHAKDYGARVNSARAGTKPAHRSSSELSQQLYLSKRGETKCCIRLELASHALFTGLPHHEFIVNCKSKWDLDEVIASTGSNRYRVLLDSSRGPMLIEFGNCVGSHFSIAKEYQESELRVGDQRVVATERPTQPGADKVCFAQQQQKAQQSVHHCWTQQDQYQEDIPKRCRPVSAGPSRSASKVTQPIRTIKTSRSAYPSTSVCPALEDTGTIHAHQLEKDEYAGSGNQKLEATKPNNTQTSSHPHGQQRRVRVQQKNELERPYCAIHKFNKMRDEERQHFYSVVNDVPYVSAVEREMVETQKNKLKWTAGPFWTAIGKTTISDVPHEPGVFASAPFIQENAPFYIIQRRELELKSSRHKPAAAQQPAQPRQLQLQQQQRPKIASFKR